EETVQPEIKSSDQNADGGGDDEQHFPVRNFPRLGNGLPVSSRHCNAWREHRLERFVIQMSIVYGHFSSMIELGVVDDDRRLQFCCQSRPRMKRGCFVDVA